jgi:transposase-like protein
MSFKLQIVQEIEQGFESSYSAQNKYGIQSRSTIVNWLRKFGKFDWQHQKPISMIKTTEQKLMELEQKVKLLEKQKSQLEKQIEHMMINLAEKEYNIPIRKNYSPEQSTTTKNKKKKA